MTTTLQMSSGVRLKVGLAYKDMRTLLESADTRLMEVNRDDGAVVLVNLDNVDYVWREEESK